MKQPHTIYLFLILAIAAISAEGCTLIGYGIGSAIKTGYSHDTTQAFTQPLFRDVKDNRGRFARIQYNDTTVRFATYEGYTDESDSEYRAEWIRFTNKHLNSSAMPFKIGDSIEVSYDYRTKYVAQFADYSPDGIDLKLPHSDQHLQLRLLSYYDYLRVSGKENSLPQLNSAFDSNAVPVRGILYFANQQNSTRGQEQFTLTNSDFLNVKFTSSSNAGMIGLAIGAVIDVAIVIAIIAQPKSSSGSGWNWGGGGLGGGGNWGNW